MEEESEEFMILAEWVIRKLRKIDFEKADDETIIRWILYSLGIEKLGQDIYLYLREKESATSTEIAEAFKISPATARKYLEQLHLIGLVDYMGREYHLSFEDIGRGLKSILLSRINDVFDSLIKASNVLRKRRLSREITFPTETVFKYDKTLKQAWSGISIKEAEDYVIMRVLRSYVLKEDILNEILRKRKKLILEVFGSLRIDKNIDPQLASSVIERITVYGSLLGPRDVLDKILSKITVYGSFKTF